MAVKPKAGTKPKAEKCPHCNKQSKHMWTIRLRFPREYKGRKQRVCSHCRSIYMDWEKQQIRRERIGRQHQNEESDVDIEDAINAAMEYDVDQIVTALIEGDVVQFDPSRRKPGGRDPFPKQMGQVRPLRQRPGTTKPKYETSYAHCSTCNKVTRQYRLPSPPSTVSLMCRSCGNSDYIDFSGDHE